MMKTVVFVLVLSLGAAMQRRPWTPPINPVQLRHFETLATAGPQVIMPLPEQPEPVCQPPNAKRARGKKETLEERLARHGENSYHRSEERAARTGRV